MGSRLGFWAVAVPLSYCSNLPGAATIAFWNRVAASDIRGLRAPPCAVDSKGGNDPMWVWQAGLVYVSMPCYATQRSLVWAQNP